MVSRGARLCSTGVVARVEFPYSARAHQEKPAIYRRVLMQKPIGVIEGAEM
jgi:hypothetical protein